MNKNECLNKIKSRKLLAVKEIINNDKIILTIELGAVIVKQSQFDILVGLIQDVSTKVDDIDTKVDAGLKEVNTKIDDVNNKVDDINTKVDNGLKEVNIKIDNVNNKVDEGFKEVRTDIKEIKNILKKHDDLFVEHQWLKQSSF